MPKTRKWNNQCWWFRRREFLKIVVKNYQINVFCFIICSWQNKHIIYDMSTVFKRMWVRWLLCELVTLLLWFYFNENPSHPSLFDSDNESLFGVCWEIRFEYYFSCCFFIFPPIISCVARRKRYTYPNTKHVVASTLKHFRKYVFPHAKERTINWKRLPYCES